MKQVTDGVDMKMMLRRPLAGKAVMAREQSSERTGSLLPSESKAGL